VPVACEDQVDPLVAHVADVFDAIAPLLKDLHEKLLETPGVDDARIQDNTIEADITGDDETSEDTSQTWDQAPYSAPTPNQPEATLLR